MTGWIIEPREPVIVRDGRPFDRQPGVMAASLPFPFPSTTAGAARSRAGSDEHGTFTASGQDLQALKNIPVRGPLLAELDEEKGWQLLAPAPGDALLLEDKEKRSLRCKLLAPIETPNGAYVQPFRRETEVPGKRLALVGQVHPDPDKPAKDVPAFWYWSNFEKWLLQPEQICNEITHGAISVQSLGRKALPMEQRVHVALERGMMVAQEGALFETRGLEFTSKPDARRRPKLAEARRQALWLDVKTDDIGSGFDCLGGERRMVHWQKSDLCSACPETLPTQIAQACACRLILLTPAYFEQGYLPDVSLLEYAGVNPGLQAVLVQRPHVISGWDMEKHKRKASRRLIPAGSVFFLTLEGPRENIVEWVKQTWMRNVSGTEQDRFDGFGLVVPGIWSGKLEKMEF